MRYIIFVSLLSGCSWLNVWPDNVIEEKVEDVIEAQTGAKIDFTGASPEGEW